MIISPLYFRLLGQLSSYWTLFLLALSAMLIMALTIAALPLCVQQLLDSTFIQRDPPTIQLASLAIVALLIVRSIASYINRYTVSKISSQLGVRLRTILFDKLFTLPLTDCHDLIKSHAIEKLILDIHRIIQTTAQNFACLVQDSLTIIGLTLALFSLNRDIALTLLLVMPLIVLIMQITQSFLIKPNQDILSASDTFIQDLLQSIRHHRVIRLDRGQTHESQRLSKAAESIQQAEAHYAALSATADTLNQIIITLILMAIVYFMAQEGLNNALLLDETGALVAAAALLIAPIQRIINIPRQLQQEQIIIENLFLMLDRESPVDTGTISPQSVRGELTFEQVCYDNTLQSVLSPVNLTVRPGETVVFMGYSDHEKTTLIDLILRFQQPTNGRILLDGHRLNDIRIDDLYAHIALIPADIALLDDKIAGNIAYGTMACANEIRITNAAQTSRAIEFIREMSEGLQTRIGRHGTEITTEHYQLLSIARALLKNPSLLILDGIPSTAGQISNPLQQALEALIQNRTTLIFTQHIPQLKKIDRILIFKNGYIIKHQEPFNPVISEKQNASFIQKDSKSENTSVN